MKPGPRAAERLHDLHRDMRGDIRATHALRLGLREIKGLKEEDARLIVERRTLYLPLRFVFTSPLRSGRWGQQQRRREGTLTPSHPPPIGRPTCAVPTRQPVASEGEARGSRGEGTYDSVRDVWLRTGLSPRVLERLADADAFASLGLTRREALWAAKALGRVGDRDDDLPLFASPLPALLFVTSPLRGRSTAELQARSGGGTQLTKMPPSPIASPCPTAHVRNPASGAREHAVHVTREAEVHLPPMPLGEEVVNDYRFLRLSLRAHPAQFLRADLTRAASCATKCCAASPTTRA